MGQGYRCVDCRPLPERCHDCRCMRAATRRKLYVKQRALGLCVICSEPAEAGMTCCTSHFASRRALYRAVRKRRIYSAR